MRDAPKIGFVGLGNMGGPMARNLLRAGFAVIAFDLDPERTEALRECGALAASSIDECASGADIVCTSLPGPAQVREISTSLFARLPRNSLWIDLSTSDLTCARALREPAAQAGVRLLDAPVSGGAEGAEAGTLTVLVGGEPETHARAIHVLAAIGSRYDLLGPHGAGYVAKIASVSLCYLHSVCLTEALLLGARGGVAPAKMLDIIRHSTGRSYVADRYGPEILSGGYDATFDLALAAKDMRLATTLAETVDATLPFTEQVRELYERADAEFEGDSPHLIAMQLLERANELVLHEQDSLHNRTST